MTKAQKIEWEKRFNEMVLVWKNEVSEIPEPTCPSIDKCIKEIDSFEREVNYLRKNANRYETAEELAKDLPEFGWNTPAYELDKNLRKDNETLRSLGIYWYEKCKEKVKDFIRAELSQQREEILVEVLELLREMHEDTIGSLVLDVNHPARIRKENTNYILDLLIDKLTKLSGEDEAKL